MAANPKPSKLAAALNYLQQIANVRGEATPDDYQQRLGLQGDATPSMSTVTQAARDFGGGVATNLGNRARDIAPVMMETVDPRALQARPATVKMLGDVASIGKAIVTDPVGTGKLIVSAEADRAKLAMNNPRSMGEYTGSFIDPLRIASALSKGNIAKRDIFIGEKAKTWDANAASKALEMEKAGIDPKEIWTETGTFRSPDGKLRQEISDKSSKITEDVYNQISANKQFKGPMEQALQHEELYKAYPQSAGIPTTMFADITPSGNILKGRNGTFQIPQITAGGPSTMDQRSVTLHELQHAIQQKEGFARGGNISEFTSGPMFNKKARDLKDDLSQIINGSINAHPTEVLETIKYADPKDLKKIIEKYGFKNIDEAKSFLFNENKKRTPLDQYLRVAGEAEARATQKRRNMTTEERRAKFPEESYDYPIKELIFP